MLGAAGCGKAAEPQRQALEYRLPETSLAQGMPTPTFTTAIDSAPVASPEAAVGVQAQSVADVLPLRQDSQPLSFYEPLMRETERGYGLAPGLLSVIAALESSGGVHACGFNAWGIGSCKGYNYSSWEEGIEAAAVLLSYWVERQGLEGALSTWVSGSPTAGLWYAAEALALMP